MLLWCGYRLASTQMLWAGMCRSLMFRMACFLQLHSQWYGSLALCSASLHTNIPFLQSALIIRVLVRKVNSVFWIQSTKKLIAMRFHKGTAGVMRIIKRNGVRVVIASQGSLNIPFWFYRMVSHLSTLPAKRTESKLWNFCWNTEHLYKLSPRYEMYWLHMLWCFW